MATAKDIAYQQGISPATVGKLGRNETVNSDVLVKICEALNCDIGDIMEVVREV